MGRADSREEWAGVGTGWVERAVEGVGEGKAAVGADVVEVLAESVAEAGSMVVVVESVAFVEENSGM